MSEHHLTIGDLVFAPKPTNHNFKDIPTGQIFGRLTVLGFAGRNSFGHVQWWCECECGQLRQVTGTRLRNGHTQSCGCLTLERTIQVRRRHGCSRTPIYQIWQGIKERCYNTKKASYADYGGRGIKMCDRWQLFDNFLADMGLPPSPDHSIDRIDNDGDYTPDNCRWATLFQQSINKRTTIFVEFRGERMALLEWCKRYDFPYQAAHHKIHERKQDIEVVFNHFMAKYSR